jgi:hypothetical protein
MSTPPIATASQARSWYLLHVLAGMTLLLVVFLVGMLIYFSLTGRASVLDVPLPLRALCSLSVIALFWLWIRMLIDFFRERPARYPVAWGWFLFLGSYIGALAYFWTVWRPRNRPAQ